MTADEIWRVKDYRNRTGCSLVEAKRAVERNLDREPLTPAPTGPQTFGVQGRDTPEVREVLDAAARHLAAPTGPENATATPTGETPGTSSGEAAHGRDEAAEDARGALGGHEASGDGGSVPGVREEGAREAAHPRGGGGRFPSMSVLRPREGDVPVLTAPVAGETPRGPFAMTAAETIGALAAAKRRGQPFEEFMGLPPAAPPEEPSKVAGETPREPAPQAWLEECVVAAAALVRRMPESDLRAQALAVLRDAIPQARLRAATPGEPNAPPPTPHFFDKRAADTLANEVARLIERRVIDTRSPAADALLDCRDGWDRGALSKQVPPAATSAETATAEGERLIDAMWDATGPAFTTARIALLDHLRALTRERDEWKTEAKLMLHKVLTCGVAASHPDPDLSRRGAYGGTWDSPQAEEVRKLRDRLRSAEAQRPARDVAETIDRLRLRVEEAEGCERALREALAGCVEEMRGMTFEGDFGKRYAAAYEKARALASGSSPRTQGEGRDVSDVLEGRALGASRTPPEGT